MSKRNNKTPRGKQMKAGDLVKLAPFGQPEAVETSGSMEPMDYITLWKERLKANDEFTQTGELRWGEVAIILEVCPHDLDEDEEIVLLDSNASHEVEILTCSGQRGWTWEHFLDGVGK